MTKYSVVMAHEAKEMSDRAKADKREMLLEALSDVGLFDRIRDAALDGQTVYTIPQNYLEYSKHDLKDIFAYLGYRVEESGYSLEIRW